MKQYRLMKQYKGDRLYVNLGPSQARRRLKGHGLGVKKVQSAGRNQAVIIHTAIGENLRQLKQLFADVGSSEIDPQFPTAADPQAAEAGEEA